MTEIHKNLYVGSLIDYEILQDNPDYSFVQACKEPCHRRAVGYSGRAAPKTHPEYLIAYRSNRIILNIVDTPTGKYFCNEIFEKSLNFIDEHIEAGRKVLIHCNQGLSRSPSIGLLFLAIKGKIRNGNFWEAKEDFLKIYPEYSPKGVQEFININWLNYII